MTGKLVKSKRNRTKFQLAGSPSYPSSSYWGSTKGGDQSSPRADSLVSLIHHGPSDHGLLIPILIITKECLSAMATTGRQPSDQAERHIASFE